MVVENTADLVVLIFSLTMIGIILTTSGFILSMRREVVEIMGNSWYWVLMGINIVIIGLLVTAVFLVLI